MLSTRTTPLGWLSGPSGRPCIFLTLLMAGPGCLPGGGGGTSTTDVVLDTGSESSETSGEPGTTTEAAESSTSGDDGTGSSSSGTPHPASSSSTGEVELCGNGVVDPGEDCDGEQSSVTDCSEIDAKYNGGAPLCDADCRFDTGPCETCEAPELAPCDLGSKDLFHAIELGCDSVEGFDPAVSAPIIGELITSPDKTAYRALRRFGKHEDAWSPRAGASALLISTGSLAEPDAQGVVLALPGKAKNGPNNANPDYPNGFPTDLEVHVADGGSKPFTDCDEKNDCSNTLEDPWKVMPRAYDLFYFELTTVVPPGTHGYALDLAFFTSHFPQYVGNDYNDIVTLWSTSELYVGNISYVREETPNGAVYRPMNLDALVDAGWIAYNGSKDAELEGTGYDGMPGQQGGASRWLTVEGPAEPGESLTLALALFDLDDADRDSAVLLDNFRWSCSGCAFPDGCGLRLAD